METIPGKGKLTNLNDKLTSKLVKVHRKRENGEQTRKKVGRTVCSGAALFGERRDM